MQNHYVSSLFSNVKNVFNLLKNVSKIVFHLKWLVNIIIFYGTSRWTMLERKKYENNLWAVRTINQRAKMRWNIISPGAKNTLNFPCAARPTGTNSRGSGNETLSINNQVGWMLLKPQWPVCVLLSKLSKWCATSVWC